MDASVIICTYNKPERLFATLCSFNTIDYNKKLFEIIICDDGSTNQIDVNLFKQFDLNIKYFVLEHKGRAAARNYGINIADGEIVVFSDDDTLVEKDFLKKHVELQSMYSECVILGNRKQIYVCDKDINEINKSNVLEKIGQHRASAQDDIYSICTKPYIFCTNPSLHWMCSTTGNMSIKRVWAKKWGGFDENFLGWGFEDIELAYRYAKNGVKFYYANDLISYHMEHLRDRGAMISEMKLNILYFYNKYNASNDIKLYWDYFRGEISLKKFDELTYNEFSSQVKDEYFYLFKRSNLEGLYSNFL